MKIFTKLVAAALVFSGLAQTATAQDNFHCGADQMRHELISLHPEVLADEAKLEAFTKQYIAEHRNANQHRDSRGDISDNKYVIPVVFHIMHRGGTENISDGQVFDQMRILNEDFNKLNADTTLVTPVFRPLIADVGITFCLATKDPNGQATNGIQHYYSSQAYQGQSNFAKMNPWPREKYLNVWVVDKMQGGVAGYAYYPGSVQSQPLNPTMDGVMILNDYIGSIGSANDDRSRALTHEIGHWLNLPHVWGDNNEPGEACGDDGVDDTPETRGWNFCPTLANADVCNPGVVENWQNFMEYSYCSYMFTPDQALRMHAALESPISGRNNLWSEENLIATGVCMEPTSTPTADFSVNKFYVCIGDPVVFNDDSWNAKVDSRVWTFTNADISTSTDSIVTVKFYNVGWNTVTLEATNQYGTGTTSRALVYVYDPNVEFPTPFFETFEEDYNYNDYWASVNVDRDEPSFKLYKTAGRSGNQSVQLNNYVSKYEQNVDELISPAYNCSTLDNVNAKASFYYSLATWNNNFAVPFYDSLVVYATKNCGTTWTRLYTDGTNNVVNAGYVPSYFIPGDEQVYWKKVSFNIPGPSSNNNFRVPKVHFKIQVWGAHNTNNFYFDDWNIGEATDPTTGINEVDFSSSLSVFPNPFDNQVSIDGLGDKKHTVSITDITGRQVYYAEGVAPVNGLVSLDLSNIATGGVYFIKVSDGKSSGNLKLVRNQ